MQPRKFQTILIPLLISLCVCSAQTQSEPGTGLEGLITISPTHPGPTREGIPNSGPLANTVFVVENEKGMVITFTTDDQGRFRVSLAPGHYTVRIKERQIRGCGPTDVDVVEGKMTSVEWRCDTGMR
jgi:hypothetical protein